METKNRWMENISRFKTRGKKNIRRKEEGKENETTQENKREASRNKEIKEFSRSTERLNTERLNAL